jgi:hypothetical protein
MEDKEKLAFNDALRLYAADMSVALDEKARAAAADRFYKALRAAKVNEKLISSSADFFAAMVGKEVEGASMLLQATSQKVSTVQGLQKDQAAMLMQMLSQPEQAKMGIVSMATSLATICRFFGADSFADSIEQKAKEISATVHIPLNTQGITTGSTDIHAAMADVQRTLGGSAALKNAGKKAEKESGDDLQNPTAPFIPGKAPAAADRTTWTAYKQAMLDAGLTDNDVKKVMPTWMATAGEKGNKTRLDTPEEAKKFLDALKKNGIDLTAEQKGKAAKVLLGLTSGALDPNAPAPHPA